MINVASKTDGFSFPKGESEPAGFVVRLRNAGERGAFRPGKGRAPPAPRFRQGRGMRRAAERKDCPLFQR